MSFSQIAFAVGLLFAGGLIVTILGYCIGMRRADERRLAARDCHPAGKGLTAEYEPGHSAEEIARVVDLSRRSQSTRRNEGVFSQ